MAQIFQTLLIAADWFQGGLRVRVHLMVEPINLLLLEA